MEKQRIVQLVNRLLIIPITLLVVLTFSPNIEAQSPTDTPDSKTETRVNDPIIDLRCSREKLLSPTGPKGEDGEVLKDSDGEDIDATHNYAQFCCESGNTENDLTCLEQKYDVNDAGLWGDRGFNFFETDVVLNRQTVVPLVRSIVTLLFSIMALTSIGVIIWGVYKWTIYPEKYDKSIESWYWIWNGMLGLVWGIGGTLITWAIFWAMGIKGNPYDIKAEFDNVLWPVDCKVLAMEECNETYDLSCIWDFTYNKCKIYQNEDGTRREPTCGSIPWGNRGCE